MFCIEPFANQPKHRNWKRVHRLERAVALLEQRKKNTMTSLGLPWAWQLEQFFWKVPFSPACVTRIFDTKFTDTSGLGQ